jgi:hypothetical protein
MLSSAYVICIDTGTRVSLHIVILKCTVLFSDQCQDK